MPKHLCTLYIRVLITTQKFCIVIEGNYAGLPALVLITTGQLTQVQVTSSKFPTERAERRYGTLASLRDAAYRLARLHAGTVHKLFSDQVLVRHGPA